MAELFGAIVFSIVLAVLYEGLKSLREYLMCVGLQSKWNQSQCKSSINDSDGEARKPLIIDTDSPDKKHRYYIIQYTYYN